MFKGVNWWVVIGVNWWVWVGLWIGLWEWVCEVVSRSGCVNVWVGVGVCVKRVSGLQEGWLVWESISNWELHISRNYIISSKCEVLYVYHCLVWLVSVAVFGWRAGRFVVILDVVLFTWFINIIIYWELEIIIKHLVIGVIYINVSLCYEIVIALNINHYYVILTWNL